MADRARPSPRRQLQDNPDRHMLHRAPLNASMLGPRGPLDLLRLQLLHRSRPEPHMGARAVREYGLRAVSLHLFHRADASGVQESMLHLHLLGNR